VTDQPRLLGGRYQLGAIIGRGGMADVIEANDIRLGRKVAIKLMRRELASDPLFLARFRREAQAAAGLNHPTIVAVYDSGEDVVGSGTEAASLPYIVMELVEGQTVRDILRSGTGFTAERALQVARDVLTALDYSHRNGIVHRDIKPANIMITKGGAIKVMDFGIARAMSDSGNTLTASQTVMGTAQYLSPEQARGAEADARSDIYSLGCLLYEMLTGKPPFTGESAVAIAYQHVSGLVISPSEINADLNPNIDALVQMALAKDAAERYQTAAEMRSDIDRVLAGDKVTAVLPTVPFNPPRATVTPVATKKKVNPWVWVLSAVGVLLTSALAVWIYGSSLNPGSGNKVEVPDLAGLSAEAAVTVLSDYNLVLGEIKAEESDRPENSIISQDPASGSRVDEGSSVNIVISGGAQQIIVPTLAGLVSAEDARRVLASVNLQLGNITSVDSDLLEGYVVGSNPPTGTLVPVGTRVSIEISNGFGVVPALEGLPEAQARSDLGAAGYQVVVVNQPSATALPGTVLAQSPAAGTRLKIGSRVSITVAQPNGGNEEPETPTP
jgi:eukaryotic-like serine/threonine-protein kinase